MADLVILENLVNQVNLDHQGVLGLEDSRALKATEENLELQALREKMVSLDHLDVMENLEKRAHLDLQAERD